MKLSKYEKRYSVPPPKRPGSPAKRQLLTLPRIVMGVAVVAVVAVAAIQFIGSGGDDANEANPNWTPQAALPSPGVQALNIEVAEPVDDLGQVPLNTGVEGKWVLRNAGTTPVTLGKPTIEVLEGC